MGPHSPAGIYREALQDIAWASAGHSMFPAFEVMTGTSGRPGSGHRPYAG